MLFCKGEKFDIDQTPEAEASWVEAASHANEACVAQLLRMIERLAQVGKLNSPEQFNNEGEGIYAIKARCGLRAYGWFHSKRRHVFMISHFIVKKRQKLDPEDLRKALENRKNHD